MPPVRLMFAARVFAQRARCAQPALNDITVPELRSVLEEAGAIDTLLKNSLQSRMLRVVGNGARGAATTRRHAALRGALVTATVMWRSPGALAVAGALMSERRTASEKRMLGVLHVLCFHVPWPPAPD